MNLVYKTFWVLFIFCCNIFSVFNTYAQAWYPVGSPGFSVGSAYYTSITIDGSGTPYVVYQDSVNGYKATVMKYDGSSWVSVGNPGFSTANVKWTSIAIDGNGTPYVVYEEDVDPGISAEQATVMEYNGTDWILVGSERFTGYMATWTSIKIDSNGTPYVGYDNYGGFNGGATVMEFDGSNWDTLGNPDFSAGYAYTTSMAIDRSGTIYMAYAQSPFDSNYYYAPATVMKYNGTGWVNVGSACFSAGSTMWTSIAIDGSGTPYVAYVDMANNNKATVMKYNGTSWVTVGNAGFSAGGVGHTSLAIDGGGTPYVVYQDSANGNKATVMSYNGSSWVTLSGAGFSSGAVQYPTMAIDGNGTPYVVYQDGGVGNKTTVMRYGWPAAVASIKNPSASTLTLFPNPTHGSFTLNISSPSNEEATITITNILGEKVKELTTITNNNTDIQLNSPPGLYFISAITKDRSIAEKIIIE